MTVPHVSVCVLTFKRSDELLRLLEKLQTQKTDGLFTYSVVVVDNDATGSAEATVDVFRQIGHRPVNYCVESEKSIARARNKALAAASGDYIAFIDDDEFPVQDWLYHLFVTCVKYDVAGVLGPVKPWFEFDPPAWAVKGKFFERPDYNTGQELRWTETRSGNVLFKSSITDCDAPFDERFADAGEDMDFFRRMIHKGCKFIWCHEALVYENVPLSRCSRTYLLKRALLRGSNFPKHPANRAINIIKSVVAVPLYLVLVPFLLLFGQHVFLKYLVKLTDHSSRLLAFMGLPLVTHRNI